MSLASLFDCIRYSVMEIDLVHVPEGITESLQYDSKRYQLQFHTGAAAGAGRRPAICRGHGVGPELDRGRREAADRYREVAGGGHTAAILHY